MNCHLIDQVGLLNKFLLCKNYIIRDESVVLGNTHLIEGLFGLNLNKPSRSQLKIEIAPNLVYLPKMCLNSLMAIVIKFSVNKLAVGGSTPNHHYRIRTCYFRYRFTHKNIYNYLTGSIILHNITTMDE